MVLKLSTHFKETYIKNKHTLLFLVLPFLFFLKLNAQESNPLGYDVPSQNLLKFNRFLINPTFSIVREDKSYINLFHRSQSSDFNDNNQNYFLSYSGQINDRVGLGISLYNQQVGIISNLGVMANYSHSIQLSYNSSLSLGVNIPYYISSFDLDRIVTLEEDPLLNNASQNSIVYIQPGLNLSLGKFDFGVFAQNLVDYNIKSGKSLTNFNEKTFSGHIQFVHEFENGAGIFEEGRLLPLVRARFEGSSNPVFGGGLIIDLPKIGWIQGGYDQFYGASAGMGFNLGRRLSFGYNFEKGINNNVVNLGVTHEVFIAFSFVPNPSKNIFESNDKGDTKKPIEENNTAENEESNESRNNASESQTDFDDTNKEDVSFREAKVKEMKEEQAVNTSSESKQESSSIGKLNKPVEKFVKFDGIDQGHYIIANVFKSEHYLKKFIAELKSKGVDAKYFKNPENGLHYVYLAKYEKSADAYAAYRSQMKGTYTDEIWIMHVK